VTDTLGLEGADVLEGLRAAFLIDARQCLAVLQGALAEHTPRPGRRRRLVTAAQRLRGTATLVELAGVARLAELVEEALEGASDDDAADTDDRLAVLVTGLDRALATVAGSGQDDPAEIERLVAALPPPAAPRRGAATRPLVASPEVPPYFAAEAHERLDEMTPAIEALAVADGPGEPVDQLLRATHSLKGAAYTVGAAASGDLLHGLETVLVAVRSRRLRPTPALADAALAVVDAVRVLVDRRPAGEQEAALGRARALVTAHLPAGAAPAAPPAPAPAAAEPGPGRAEPRPDAVRVPVARLDAMLDLVGQLLAARGRLDARLAQVERVREVMARSRAGLLREDDGTGALGRRVGEIAADLGERDGQVQRLMQGARDDAALLHRLGDRLRGEVVQARLVPVARLFARVAREVRETARAADRAVTVEVTGEAVELDSAVLERLADPLLHLARNAVTHGIEPEAVRRRRGKPARGTVRLMAEPRGRTIRVRVGDDGAGIDPGRVRAAAVRSGLLTVEAADRLADAEALELIYRPGFSTATRVTTTAGRGVGMDVVRAGVTRLGGSIEVETAPGAGTTFTIELPPAVLVAEALMVRVGPETLAIPLHAVRQVLMARAEWFGRGERGETLALYRETADVVRLERALGVRPAAGAAAADPAGLDAVPVVVVHGPGEPGGPGRPAALVVDEILEKEAIVVKPLGPFLEGLGPFAGGTVAADGRVVLVLDPGRLLQPAGGASTRILPGAPAEPAEATPTVDAAPADDAPPPAPAAAAGRPTGRRVLLADDSISVRTHVGRLLERAGFEVGLATDGVEALAALETSAADVVITDLEMPRMNGFELIQALRRQPAWHALPVVVLTTRAGSEYLELARWLGADHYVSKPVDEGAFVALIASLVPAPPA
jgi:chemosensory pili system protein ChpA (sensor histidine kinase/response regulator)